MTNLPDHDEEIVFDHIASEYRKKSKISQERIRKLKRDANKGTRV